MLAKIALAVALIVAVGVISSAWFMRDAPTPVVIFLASKADYAINGTNGAEPLGADMAQYGYSVRSFDLFCESDKQLTCWSWRVKQGETNFVNEFCQHIREVIDGWGNVYVQMAGTSRGGYVAATCAAQDDRIRALALIAPVTDLTELSEFDGVEVDPASFGLDRYAEALSKIPVMIRISQNDDRVNTAAAVRFGESVGAMIELLPDPGHRAPDPQQVMAKWLNENWQSRR